MITSSDNLVRRISSRTNDCEYSGSGRWRVLLIDHCDQSLSSIRSLSALELWELEP